MKIQKEIEKVKYVALEEELRRLNNSSSSPSVNHRHLPTTNRPRYTNRYSGLNLQSYIHDNTSQYINRKTVQKIFNAWDFAEFQGRPINHFCVINLQDEVSQSSNTCFTKIRRKYGAWLRRCSINEGQKYQPTYVYTFENPNSNIHVNWCLHIPDNLENSFQSGLKRWVEKSQGPLNDTTICITKIRYGVDSYKSVANYITKGVDPDYITHFHLQDYQSDKGAQGTVWGKRAGFSQAIGVTAQRKVEFNAKAYRATRAGW